MTSRSTMSNTTNWFAGNASPMVPRLTRHESSARVRQLRARGCKVERRRLPNGDVVVLKSGCRLEENPVSTGWWVAGAVALGGIVLLFAGKKKKSTTPSPTTAPPPTTKTNFVPIDRLPTLTPSLIPIPNRTASPCTVTKDQFEKWGDIAVRSGPWLPSLTSPPPSASAIKAQFPEFANIPDLRLMTMTNNGTKLWFFTGFGVPYESPVALKNVCDLAANPNTVVIGT